MLLILPILLGLGIWQLQRADYKKTLLVEYQLRGELPPFVALDLNKPVQQLQYHRVQLKGRFDNQHTILIDNKSHQHQAGYHVLTPFIWDSKEPALLVNRGWIPRNGDRGQLPVVSTVEGQQTIVGTIWIPQKGFVLQADQTMQPQWPYLAQTIDLERFSQLLEHKLYPFVLLLAPDVSGGFVREWNLVTVSPQKNYGYAFQWFALAAALVIIFIVVNTRRRK
jgi:surfeit locus 1 family protein